MKEQARSGRFEANQHDEHDVDEPQPGPPVPDPDELWDEEGRARQRTRSVPIVYYVRRPPPPSHSSDR